MAALAVTLTACGPRDRTGSQDEPAPVTSQSSTVDPAAAQDALDDLDDLLGDVDGALAEADAYATADAD